MTFFKHTNNCSFVAFRSVPRGIGHSPCTFRSRVWKKLWSSINITSIASSVVFTFNSSDFEIGKKLGILRSFRVLLPMGCGDSTAVGSMSLWFGVWLRALPATRKVLECSPDLFPSGFVLTVWNLCVLWFAEVSSYSESHSFSQWCDPDEKFSQASAARIAGGLGSMIAWR